MNLKQLAVAKEVAVGKSDQFPIAGVRALQESDDCELENPLLIDPTVVDPSNHLTWSFDHDLGVAIPVVLEGREDPLGVATIFTFALNRQALVEARTEVLTALKAQMVMIRGALSKAASIDNEVAREALVEMAMGLIQHMRQFGDSTREYSAFVNAFLRDQLDSLIEEFEGVLRRLA